MKPNFRRSVLALFVPVCAMLLHGQGNSSDARLRSLNAQVLQLRGQLYGLAAGQQGAIQSQAGQVLQQRQALLQLLMQTNPKLAAALAFPADVLGDLANAFPQSARALEQRGNWQGALELFVEDGVGGASHKERRQLRVDNQSYELHQADDKGIGTLCNETIAASGFTSGNQLVAESTTVVASATNPCSTTGPQKIAVILVSFPSKPISTTITQDFLNGVFLGNAYTSKTATPDRSISDMWFQNSDGKTWVNASGTGALTIVGPYTLSQDYSYCSVSSSGSYSDNSSAVRSAAYAAADGALNYGDFSRLVVVLPNNGSCSPIAGVGTIGCSSGTCPGDGACNFSWTWWRDDQIGSRDWGVELGTHEMGHNLGLGHSGSRYHGNEVVQGIDVAGFRTEYNDRFSTMGNWNFGFYNAFHSLNQLGWMSSTNVPTITNSGTYTIEGYDVRPFGTKALRIKRGSDPTKNAWLYLDYYPNTGIYLSALGSPIHNGAIIHYQDAATPSLKTDLLDFTPTLVDTTTTTPNFSDPVLATGQTWVDAYTDLSLTINSIAGGVMSVTVNYNTPPCTASNPTVNISPLTGASVYAGSPYGFTVSVTNNDSSSCAARTFNLASSLPSDAGWLSSFSSPSVAINPGATANVTLTKTPPSNALGTYFVDATATSGANVGTTNTSASLTVSTPPPMPPAAPSNLTGTAQYSGSGKTKVFLRVNLAWVDNANNETSTNIERCKVTGKGSSASCTFAPLVTLGANATSYQDNAPIPAGTYRYRVNAANANGPSGWSNTLQIQIQ